MALIINNDPNSNTLNYSISKISKENSIFNEDSVYIEFNNISFDSSNDETLNRIFSHPMNKTKINTKMIGSSGKTNKSSHFGRWTSPPDLPPPPPPIGGGKSGGGPS